MKEAKKKKRQTDKTWIAGRVLRFFLILLLFGVVGGVVGDVLGCDGGKEKYLP